MPMTKLYFRHDFHSRNDPQLLEINMALGMEGIGIYWSLLEMFYERDGYVSEKDLKLMCFEIHIDYNKAKKILDMAKFKCDKNGIYFKEGVLNRITNREETSKKKKDAAESRWGKNTNAKKREAPIPDWMKEQQATQGNKKMSEEEKEQLKKIFE